MCLLYRGKVTPTILQVFGEDIKHNFTTVLLWTLGILGGVGSAITGLGIKHLKRLDNIKKLEEEMKVLKEKQENIILVDDIQTQVYETKKIDEKIRQMKSISWWQFWK